MIRLFLLFLDVTFAVLLVAVGVTGDDLSGFVCINIYTSSAHIVRPTSHVACMCTILLGYSIRLL